MDFTEMRAAARANVPDLAWKYYESTADDSARAARRARRRDRRAWESLEILPRALRGLREPETSVILTDSIHRGGVRLSSPVMVSPTAGHGLAHPDGEIATGRAAAESGTLMVYSNSATVEVGAFGAAMTGPWWVQQYLLRDRARSFAYLDRAIAAGAGAVVLTVDLGHSSADPSFRSTVQTQLGATLGNYPDMTWPTAGALYENDLTPDVIGEIADHTGVPVHAKGIMRPDDALRAVDAGASGIIVSNHGRRQLAGVAPSATVLASIVDAVAGTVPVMVDGAIRSGADALRALSLGAALVGVGRPVLWGLAAGGTNGVTRVLSGLTAELGQAMAAAGARTIDDIGRDLLVP